MRVLKLQDPFRAHRDRLRPARNAGSSLHALWQDDCRCKADRPVLHGLYWHWTRTLAGKTQSRTLTEEQAQRYQPWFDNARRLRGMLTDLEERSLRAFRDAEDQAS